MHLSPGLFRFRIPRPHHPLPVVVSPAPPSVEEGSI
jgi:hypothetical protein